MGGSSGGYRRTPAVQERAGSVGRHSLDGRTGVTCRPSSGRFGLEEFGQMGPTLSQARDRQTAGQRLGAEGGTGRLRQERDLSRATDAKKSRLVISASSERPRRTC